MKRALYQRLLAAHCTESTIDIKQSAKILAAEVERLEQTFGRPRPCGGELAPEARTYGPGGMAA